MMNNSTVNLLIFSSLIIISAVIIKNHYSGIQEDLKKNWGI